MKTEKTECNLITEISIKNFRCFSDAKFGSFKRINLFGGENGIGKTYLLEAIYLACEPTDETVMQMRHFRDEQNDIKLVSLNFVWHNWFYNGNHNEPISIIAKTKDDSFGGVISYKKKQEANVQKQREVGFYSNLSILPIINEKEETEKETNVSFSKATIQISDRFNKQKFKPSYFVTKNKVGIDVMQMAAFEDNYVFNENSTLLSDSLKIFNDKIEKVRSYAIEGYSYLHICENNKRPILISLCGGMINRITEIILMMRENRGGVILIDEIENGLHYTAQKDLWKMIFNLSLEFDVQIFATTHSQEMIISFMDVCEELQRKDDACYFEMFREFGDGQVITKHLDFDYLEYQINRNSFYRGE